MEADAPIDVGRLSRPEADAFRYIAQALGAQFEGDLPDRLDPRPLSRPPVDHLAVRWDKPKGSMLDIAPDDPRTRELLERMPIACLVIVNDDVAFINRAAVDLFGYRSANILEAAGGMGALFASGGPEQPGLMTLRTASGHTFAAKVTMATIDWDAERAMILTASAPHTDVPFSEPKAPLASESSGDLLIDALDAISAPIAILSRGGHVEMCNRAFEQLAPGRAADALENRLDPADLVHVFDVMSLCFMLADGQSRTNRPVVAGGIPYWVSVGALRGGRLCAMVFHTLPASNAPMPAPRPDRAGMAARALSAPPLQEGPPSADTSANDDAPGPNPVRPAETQPETAGGSPLYRAICDVRRLVKDAAFLLVSDEDERVARAVEETDDPEAHLLRMVLLTLAMRGEAHAVLSVRRAGERIVIDVPAAPLRALERVAESDRVAELSVEARRDVTVDMAGAVTIEPLNLPEGASIIDFTR